MKPQVAHYNKKSAPDKKLKIQAGEKKNDRRNTYYIIGAIFVALLMFSISYLNFLKRPADRDGDFQYVEIKKGSSTYTIGKELQRKKLVRSAVAFYVFAKSSGKGIQAGYYQVSPQMNLSDIIDKFVRGDIDAVQVTVPEGFRALQIAKLLRDEINIDPNAFIASAVGTEGTLFPDTYVFPKKIETAKIVKQMQDNFYSRTQGLNLGDDDLILASIIEREALKDDERPKIAAIYKNRISRSMLLQADPTVRYALDTKIYLKDKSVNFDFWTGITRDDYQNTASPFNTYLQRGLPPAPICNPGLKSIEAALNPAKDFNYLFFFHDREQNIQFSNTYEEHLQKIQEFGVSGS